MMVGLQRCLKVTTTQADWLELCCQSYHQELVFVEREWGEELRPPWKGGDTHKK